MKKLFFTLFAIGTIFSFSACGSDDPDPIDYTLYDKSELIGSHNGKMEASVTIGNFTPYTENAMVSIRSSNDNATLLDILEPVYVGAQTKATEFMKSADDKKYTFKLDNFTIGTKVGGEIPEYIKQWHKDYEISKIILKDFSCADGAIYDKTTKTTSFIYKGALEVYSKDKDGVEESVAKHTFVLKFTELKK